VFFYGRREKISAKPLFIGSIPIAASNQALPHSTVTVDHNQGHRLLKRITSHKNGHTSYTDCAQA